jgi:hypothetical protein
MKAQGVKVTVRGWATRKRVRCFPPNYWVADLCIGETKPNHSSKPERPESEQTDTEADTNDAIGSRIQIRFGELIGASPGGWRDQLQIAVYDAADDPDDNSERWMALAEFENR